jgi:hypothetical protein
LREAQGAEGSGIKLRKDMGGERSSEGPERVGIPNNRVGYIKGNGSITAFPIVETINCDVTE